MDWNLHDGQRQSEERSCRQGSGAETVTYRINSIVDLEFDEQLRHANVAPSTNGSEKEMTISTQQSIQPI